MCNNITLPLVREGFLVCSKLDVFKSSWQYIETGLWALGLRGDTDTFDGDFEGDFSLDDAEITRGL